MFTRTMLWGTLLACFATVASGNAITYQVTVNTSSVSGTAGSLDFNFNPGPLNSQAASVQVLGFTSDGTATGSPFLTGNVSGALPGTLVFNNGSGFNDYFQGFTFGSTLSFSVSLSGPALTSPDGTSTSGSTFAFGLFSDPDGTIPALTSDTVNGFVFTTDVNLDGSTSVTNLSLETNVGSDSVSTTPEPASFALVSSSAVMIGAFLWFKRRETKQT